MSVPLIEAYYAAFNGGDWPGMLACLTEDVTHDINQGPRETGRDAFRAFLTRMERCYREHVAELVVMVSADGQRAAAEFVIHGTYLVGDEGMPPATGQSYVLPVGAFFEFRDGRIGRVTNHYNLENWLRQVATPGAP